MRPRVPSPGTFGCSSYSSAFASPWPLSRPPMPSSGPLRLLPPEPGAPPAGGARRKGPPAGVVWLPRATAREPSRCSLVVKAARLLSPPTRFEASKLEVVFLGEEIGKHPPCTISRTYALTHCDLTANLTLAISNHIRIDQLRRWQAKLQSDDVVAEWRMTKDETSLHVHCHVSGTNLLQDLAAEFRYHIFSKELPLVLKAVVHGDSILFEEHPELMEASVWVYFHSNSMKYNHIECWGPLEDAMKRTLEDKAEHIQSVVERSFDKWISPKSIIHALVAFLL